MATACRALTHSATLFITGSTKYSNCVLSFFPYTRQSGLPRLIWQIRWRHLVGIPSPGNGIGSILKERDAAGERAHPTILLASLCMPMEQAQWRTAASNSWMAIDVTVYTVLFLLSTIKTEALVLSGIVEVSWTSHCCSVIVLYMHCCQHCILGGLWQSVSRSVA